MLPALAEFVLFQDYAKSGNCSSRIFKFDAGQCHFSDSWISVVAVKGGIVLHMKVVNLGETLEI